MFEREFGPITIHERIDAAAGIIAATVAATIPRRGRTPPTPADFVPRWAERYAAPEPRVRQTPEEMMAMAAHASAKTIPPDMCFSLSLTARHNRLAGRAKRAILT